MTQHTDLLNIESNLDLLWGAPAIAAELNTTTRRVFYLLETAQIPAQKVGRQWVSSRQALRQFFAALSSSADAA